MHYKVKVDLRGLVFSMIEASLDLGMIQVSIRQNEFSIPLLYRFSTLGALFPSLHRCVKAQGPMARICSVIPVPCFISVKMLWGDFVCESGYLDYRNWSSCYVWIFMLGI